MSTVTLIHYEDASPEVQAVFDDIKRTRNIPDVNNFLEGAGESPGDAETHVGGAG